MTHRGDAGNRNVALVWGDLHDPVLRLADVASHVVHLTVQRCVEQAHLRRARLRTARGALSEHAQLSRQA